MLHKKACEQKLVINQLACPYIHSELLTNLIILLIHYER